MSKDTKNGIITLIGGAGLIALLLPIFTGIYSFSWGLIVAIAIWIITGAVATMLGVGKKGK